MTLALASARAALHTVLTPILPAGRVHDTPPAQLVAPCIWIDQPTGSISDGLTIAEYPIHLVADGNPPEQCHILDNLLDATWTVLTGPYIPLDFTPGTVDPGSGREELREFVVNVQVMVEAVTFCPPTPAVVPAWPTVSTP